MGGLKQADAINMVRSSTSLVLAFFFIFLCSFAQALQWQIISNLTPYVTSEFSSHSLIPTIDIVASILSGVLKLPFSKLINASGRPIGLVSMTALPTVGLVLMATCRDVETYAAAQVFYQVGLSGLSYILDIIISDTSSLQNRVFAFAFSSMPNLITTFVGPIVACAFYEKSSWRWAFGFSAILFVILSMPILAILVFNMRKAVRLGLLQDETRIPKSPGQHLRDYDALGILLITVGLTMIFVPVSLGTTQGGIREVVVVATGFLLLLAFVWHEKVTAENPLVDLALLFSSNVAGAFLCLVLLFVAYYSWDLFYSSYLQVVHGLTITQAGYITHIYGFGSCIWAFVVGYFIRVSNRYKWLAWCALPVQILGGCLVIAFRRPDTHIGFLVLCQVLVTVSGSTLVICCNMAVMSSRSRDELASAMAVLSLASYIGFTVGSSLSGAI